MSQMDAPKYTYIRVTSNSHKPAGKVSFCKPHILLQFGGHSDFPGHVEGTGSCLDAPLLLDSVFVAVCSQDSPQVQSSLIYKHNAARQSYRCVFLFFKNAYMNKICKMA